MKCVRPWQSYSPVFKVFILIMHQTLISSIINENVLLHYFFGIFVLIIKLYCAHISEKISGMQDFVFSLVFQLNNGAMQFPLIFPNQNCDFSMSVFR